MIFYMTDYHEFVDFDYVDLCVTFSSAAERMRIKKMVDDQITSMSCDLEVTSQQNIYFLI